MFTGAVESCVCLSAVFVAHWVRLFTAFTAETWICVPLHLTGVLHVAVLQTFLGVVEWRNNRIWLCPASSIACSSGVTELFCSTPRASLLLVHIASSECGVLKDCGQHEHPLSMAGRHCCSWNLFLSAPSQEDRPAWVVAGPETKEMHASTADHMAFYVKATFSFVLG